MPTYEYECGHCGHLFERKQRFDEEPIGECPRCQGKARRVFHSVPIIFKGGGFHITDHRKGHDTKETEEKGTQTGKQKEPIGGESATAASH